MWPRQASAMLSVPESRASSFRQRETRFETPPALVRPNCLAIRRRGPNSKKKGDRASDITFEASGIGWSDPTISTTCPHPPWLFKATDKKGTEHLISRSRLAAIRGRDRAKGDKEGTELLRTEKEGWRRPVEVG